MLPNRTVGYLADRAGNRFAVVHVEIEFYGTFGVFGEKHDDVFHFLMGFAKAVIVGKCDVCINVQ